MLLNRKHDKCQINVFVRIHSGFFSYLIIASPLSTQLIHFDSDLSDPRLFEFSA